MNIVLVIATVVLAKFIGSQVGFSYQLFSDPFSFKYAIMDLSLFIVVGTMVSFFYNQAKRLFNI
ncbi:hypothetical protein KI743_08270 [Vibrio sp. D420a]|uniref:hypothetical protein n=1 Tax=Vibrio sp. D420a TaxID=2836895 RepID=UPI0025553177|nr:hypothetical protein [Vibrio sp. D420a]MDK9761996.1 hypothetical protein [Vibrio sp. D420a]